MSKSESASFVRSVSVIFSFAVKLGMSFAIMKSKNYPFSTEFISLSTRWFSTVSALLQSAS